ncbi:MAG: hypothetical protein A4E53_04473 [Pelotomaculum sp. PtaB.Bin104]|nr:MAG: hypothetical protein A4E53_04473 [Pelotomaculum sp. PtaB.Bin104]
MAAAGALGGIAFALYGWIMSKEIPRLVEEKVDERIKEIRDDVNIQFYRQQEAMQKIIASYNVEDPGFVGKCMGDSVRQASKIIGRFLSKSLDR